MKLVTLLLLSFAAANATSIIVSQTAGAFTQRTGMQTVTFDNLPVAGVTYTVQDGLASFDGALSVGSTAQLGQVLLTFERPINYFGLYPISEVPLSAICFYTQSSWIGTLYGGQFGMGSYLNFDIKEAPIKYVILWSEHGSFVSDNHGFGVSNPEPASVWLVALGIAAAGGIKFRMVN